MQSAYSVDYIFLRDLPYMYNMWQSQVENVYTLLIGLIQLALLMLYFESRAQELVYVLQIYRSYYAPHLSILGHPMIKLYP